MDSFPRKRLNKIEKKVFDILNSLQRSVQTNAAVGKYNVDFLVDGKYIIECYGDFWHCNPTKYSAGYFNRGKKKTAEEIWERDECRKQLFEQLGYEFLFLWESEINGNTKASCKRIKHFVKHDTQEQ